jgi:hypothetical protein
VTSAQSNQPGTFSAIFARQSRPTDRRHGLDDVLARLGIVHDVAGDSKTCSATYGRVFFRSSGDLNNSRTQRSRHIAKLDGPQQDNRPDYPQEFGTLSPEPGGPAAHRPESRVAYTAK